MYAWAQSDVGRAQLRVEMIEAQMGRAERERRFQTGEKWASEEDPFKAWAFSPSVF